MIYMVRITRIHPTEPSDWATRLNQGTGYPEDPFRAEHPIEPSDWETRLNQGAEMQAGYPIEPSDWVTGVNQGTGIQDPIEPLGTG